MSVPSFPFSRPNIPNLFSHNLPLTGSEAALQISLASLMPKPRFRSVQVLHGMVRCKEVSGVARSE